MDMEQKRMRWDFKGMQIVGFRGIGRIGDSVWKWLRYKVFGCLRRQGGDGILEDFKGFESGFLQHGTVTKRYYPARWACRCLKK
uniref:Uncharacterized protein n=1 Tax=Siphoviridae sp. ct96x5 TaxID=2825367 RepID=A0A8S5PRR8_9CAUD|nr:MAG TPA: hypothetical protein [Siphoviridae sp. ct96x5]